MRPIVPVVAVACLAAVSVHAQGAAKPAPSGQTFRTATRLIQVSVVVHDDQRRPIEGLRAEDFQLFEDGKPLPVSLFAVRQQPEVSELTAATNSVFTNRVQSPSNGGVVAIVYDLLNTAASDQVRAREHILKYLRKVRPDDRVALYTLSSGGMYVLHDFTRDTRSLLAALDRTTPMASAELAGSQMRLPTGYGEGISAFEAGTFNDLKTFDAGLRTTTTIEGLESVAAHLSGVPGRKNLIWVSSGFPFRIAKFGPAGPNDDSWRAINALSNSDIAAYPVDAKGLVGAFSSPADASRQTATTLAWLEREMRGLRHVAESTGGRAFFNTNDLGAAIANAVEDSRLTYIVGYYPANEDWDGRFRTIKVKVRGRDTELRHRKGYYATPPERPGGTSRLRAVQQALDSPLEATSLPLSVGVTRQDDGRYLLTIQTDPTVPTFVRQNDAWKGQIDVAVVQTLASGEHVDQLGSTIPFSLTDDIQKTRATGGVRVTHTIALRPDAHQVRVVVRDVNSGTIGSVIITAGDLRQP